MMKTLFATTDFSAAGNNAVKYAIRFAADMKYNVCVFHVMDMPKFKPTLSETKFLDLEHKEKNAKKKKLDQLLNKIYKEEDIKTVQQNTKVIVHTGFFVTETLLRAASESKADIIILGTHGIIGFKMFSSITSEVILKSKIPVLAIPEGYSYRKLQTMVYATDLKNLVQELKAIIPFVKKLDAVIEVLYLDFGWHESITEAEISEIAKKARYKKLKVVVQKEIKGLTLLGQIQQYLKDRNPECLVMFPEERSLFDRLFVRGKTEELVYRTSLPMLTIRKSLFELS